VVSKAPHDPSPPSPDLEGLTEEQLRARCQAVFAEDRDPRLPPVGGILTHSWRDTIYQVRILDDGFEYDGQTYENLTDIARRITDGRYTSGAGFFSLDRIRNRHKPPPRRQPAEPAYPLGQLSERIREDLIRADYGSSTIDKYLGRVQQFASHHMRSPLDMGEAEVVQFLIHLVENRNASLGNYRAVRRALRALYSVSLRRPREVEHIPNRPEALLAYAAGLKVHATDAFDTAVSSTAGAVLAAPTVS